MNVEYFLRRCLAVFYLPRFTHEEMAINTVPHACDRCGALWYGRYEDNRLGLAPTWCCVSNPKENK